MFVDYVIVATAWAKNLLLLTRNKKHFEKNNEIKLNPVLWNRKHVKYFHINSNFVFEFHFQFVK